MKKDYFEGMDIEAIYELLDKANRDLVTRICFLKDITGKKSIPKACHKYTLFSDFFLKEAFKINNENLFTAIALFTIYRKQTFILFTNKINDSYKRIHSVIIDILLKEEEWEGIDNIITLGIPKIANDPIGYLVKDLNYDSCQFMDNLLINAVSFKVFEYAFLSGYDINYLSDKLIKNKSIDWNSTINIIDLKLFLKNNSVENEKIKSLLTLLDLS